MHEILNISVTETGSEPISLNDAKTWLRIDWMDEDYMLPGLIKAARQAVENYCSISLVEKVIECHVIGKGLFELPYGPTRDQTAKDRNGNDVSLSMMGDKVVINGEVKILYEAGYNPIPERLLLAVKNELAFRHQNRGDQSKDLTLGVQYLCESALSLCQEYRRLAWL